MDWTQGWTIKRITRSYVTTISDKHCNVKKSPSLQAAAAVKDGDEYEVDEDAIDDAAVAETIARADAAGNNWEEDVGGHTNAQLVTSDHACIPNTVLYYIKTLATNEF